MRIDPVSKEAITEVRDSFGHTHLVQTRLLTSPTSHAEDVAAAQAVMDENERRFIARLKELGHTDAEIEALKVDPKSHE